MSGKVALRDSIRRSQSREARRARKLERGSVKATAPLTVELEHYGYLLTSANDFFLSQWARLYDHVVGISVDDLVLMEKGDIDWVLVDVVSDADVVGHFDSWNQSMGPS
jgi:hypothetical protein